MINIHFFSKYREQMGLSSLEFDCAGILTVRDLLVSLKKLYPEQTAFLSDHNLLIAVNREIASIKTPLINADEVAFFPPVSGG